jgi:hypothetical protein
VIGCTVIANANSAMRKCGPFWRSRDVTLYYGSAHDERTSFAEIIRRLFDGQRVRFGGRRLRRLVVFISVVFRSIAAEMYGANPQRAVRTAATPSHVTTEIGRQLAPNISPRLDIA